MIESIEFVILGKKYFFKTDEPEKVLRNVESLKKQLNDLNKKFNTVEQKKLFVLCSLILIDRLNEEKEKNQELKTKIDQLNSLVQTALT